MHARLDQVRELTRGAKLPLPEINREHVNVIIEAIFRAWQALIKDYGHKLLSRKETELNSLLQSRLNHQRQSDKMLSQIVSAVVRGGETISFNGANLEKRPDLAFFLTRRNANFPLVAECKIIDHADRKTVGLYCSSGLRRFVDGEYAWASSQALMLAYVRDTSTIESTLLPHLKASTERSPDPFQTIVLPRLDPLSRVPTAQSHHRRPFRYAVCRDSEEPGPISICHVWIACI